MCVSLYSVYLYCSVLASVVKMSRLSATTCQDVSSLGRGILCVCACVSLKCVYMCTVLCEPQLSR